TLKRKRRIGLRIALTTQYAIASRGYPRRFLTAWSRQFTVRSDMNRRLTQRGKERRRQLMEHATELFAGQGYHPTSVAEIVQGLGVGKGVFYWYFSSKEELLIEILREAQHDLRRAQQQAIGDE